MTKKEFKEKYCGKSVRIDSLMQEACVMSKQIKIQKVCRAMGLETFKTATTDSYLLITIIDKPQTVPIVNIFIEEQELLEDFRKIQEELDFGEVRQFLRDFGVQYDRISKSQLTVADMRKDGFIQANTSSEASLWWHQNGECIIFVRGVGAFQFTYK